MTQLLLNRSRFLIKGAAREVERASGTGAVRDGCGGVGIGC